MIVAYISAEAERIVRENLPREAILSCQEAANGRRAIGLRNDYFFRIENLMNEGELISDAIIRTRAGTLKGE